MQAAVIAAVVGSISSLVGVWAKHRFEGRSLVHRLEAEFEYAQRQQLRDAIAADHGRVLERAERLDHRLWNLQENVGEGWLNVGGDYRRATKHYYFTSTVYRFLVFHASARRFLGGAIYIDPRYGTEKDVLFLKYLKALEWVCTDVALLDNLEYDPFQETDHLFRGTLRAAAEGLRTPEGEILSEAAFTQQLEEGTPGPRLTSVLGLFDGLRPDEDRYRWDRTIALHLILMGFMHEFGYDMQRPSKEQFRETASRLRNPAVAENLAKWLRKLGLSGTVSELLIRNGMHQCFPTAVSRSWTDRVRLLRS